MYSLWHRQPFLGFLARQPNYRRFRHASMAKFLTASTEWIVHQCYIPSDEIQLLTFQKFREFFYISFCDECVLHNFSMYVCMYGCSLYVHSWSSALFKRIVHPPNDRTHRCFCPPSIPPTWSHRWYHVHPSVPRRSPRQGPLYSWPHTSVWWFLLTNSRLR